MGRLGQLLAMLSLAALLAGCGWNPGFGSGDASKVGPYAGDFNRGVQTGGGQGGNSGGTNNGSQGGSAGGSQGGSAGGGQGGNTGGGQGGQGGSAGGGQPVSTVPVGQERLSQKVLVKGEVSLVFDTLIIAENGMEIQGTAKDETSARDLSRIDMIVRVYDSRGSYSGTGADLGTASGGSLKFRLGFQPPQEKRYVIALDGLRVLRTPAQPVFPLSRGTSLPAGGRVASYTLDDSGTWTVRLTAATGVHYRVQMQWSDGRTFVAKDEQPLSGSTNPVTWELHFSGTPSEGKPAALQIPEYTRDYLNLNQTIRS